MKNIKFNNMKILLLIISVILTIFSVLFTVNAYIANDNVQVNLLIKSEQTRDYRIYYDDFNKDYPFGSLFLDGEIKGDSKKQLIHVTIPANRTKNLRIDLGMSNNEVSSVVLYKIQLSNILFIKEISSKYINQHFEGINGAIVERLDNGLKVVIGGKNQYIVSNSLIEPELVHFNYFNLVLVVISELCFWIIFFNILQKIIEILKTSLKNEYRVVKKIAHYAFLNLICMYLIYFIWNIICSKVVNSLFIFSDEIKWFIIAWIITVLILITCVFLIYFIKKKKHNKNFSLVQILKLINWKKNNIAILSLLTVFILCFMAFNYIIKQQEVRISFNVQSNKTIDCLFFYDNLSKEYPFSNGYSLNDTIKGKEVRQKLTFKLPYNRIQKLRLDFHYAEPGPYLLNFYDINIKTIFWNSIISGKDVSQNFFGINGTKMEQLDDSLKVIIDGDNQYIVTTQYPNPKIVSYNYSAYFAYIVVAIFLYLIIYGFYYILFKAWKLKDDSVELHKSILIYFLVGVYTTNLILFTSYIIQYQSFYKTLVWIIHHKMEYIISFIFIFLLYLILQVLCGRVWIATLLIGLCCILPVLINYYKLLYRGTPFFPWDISLIKEVKSIISGFKIEVNLRIVLLIILLLIYTTCMYFIPKVKFTALKIGNKVLRMCIPILLILILITFVKSVYLGNYYTIGGWNSIEDYKEYGFFNTFMAEIKCYHVKKPQDYSKTSMLSIKKKVDKLIENNEKKTNNVKPNIILIMSESFWDVTKLPNVKFSEDLFPTINMLRNSSISGNLFTSIFGGGTASTEFEVMTGFSKEFLPIESTPYQQLVTRRFSSLAQFEKTQGYSTVALHPYLAKNWNRNVAYPNMGFDKFLTMDNFVRPEIKRNFISDEEVSKKIIEEYKDYSLKSKKPWMNLTVTVQNHPAYSSKRWNSSELIDFNATGLSDNEVDGLKDLATGLHYSDKALGELIQYFKNVKEPTIIVFFGDHMTGFGNPAEKGFIESGYLPSNSTLSEKKYKLHLSTVVAWSNYKNVKCDLGDISSYQLMPKLMQTFGLKEPDFFKFLNVLYNVSPGLSFGIALNPDQSHSTELTKEQKELYHMYELIQYDYLYGKNYLGNKFFGY
ncbi:LTA synthase family protein [Anaeromicropila herbilytica]|uniref:Sulfatase N-terminal domain-containing protein n=1 Tax=Anaeromicropila herbilytica TaxID=2785025 RepID=A0A7R7ENN0_9FIRM|nr:alkaline phosphatase family protein [Anaeromicropila herbilytica]BCN32216.1 hypothetical protein bsdtb5_35110 [Anaeromicropila herbilytica]